MASDRNRAPASPVREALRSATAAVHERLHVAAPFQAIAAGALPAERYGRLLGRIHAFHSLVDPHTTRLEALEADLEELHALAAVPPLWERPEGAAARLGCDWVALGSAIGGKLIYRQLDYLFGSTSAGRRYFLGSPGEAKAWRALCRRLEEEGSASAPRAEMVAGARSAFALFERCIGEPALV